MRHYSFRTFAVALLVCLSMLLSTSSVGATPRSTHLAQAQARHSFKPTGSRHAASRKINLSKVPQVKGKGHGPVVHFPAPASTHHGGSPRHVVKTVPSVHRQTVADSVFGGISDTGWKPSDSNGAGGPDNYVETVNEQWAIYTRDGSPQFSTSFQSWFGNSNSLFDPHVVFDPWGGRFIFIVDAGSSILVSVAQQTDALGNYCNYVIPTDSGNFADFPTLGVNLDGVYFGVNIYDPSGTTFLYPQLFFLNRQELENCQTVNYVFWTRLTNPDGSFAFAITPSLEQTYPGVEYLVNSYPGGACQFTLWTLDKAANLTNTTVNTQCYSPPPAAQQAGSGTLVSTGDNRLAQANYSNGILDISTVGAFDWGDGNGPVGIIEWFRIDTSSQAVAQQGAFGAPGFWYFYPAMETSSTGLDLFVYNSSGSSIDPSIWYTVFDPFGGSYSSFILASGGGPAATGGGRCSVVACWGDYSSARIDPIFPNSIWINGQYAQSANFWSTEVGLITP